MPTFHGPAVNVRGPRKRSSGTCRPAHDTRPRSPISSPRTVTSVRCGATTDKGGPLDAKTLISDTIDALRTASARMVQAGTLPRPGFREGRVDCVEARQSPAQVGQHRVPPALGSGPSDGDDRPAGHRCLDRLPRQLGPLRGDRQRCYGEWLRARHRPTERRRPDRHLRRPGPHLQPLPELCGHAPGASTRPTSWLRPPAPQHRPYRSLSRGGGGIAYLHDRAHLHDAGRTRSTRSPRTGGCSVERRPREAALRRPHRPGREAAQTAQATPTADRGARHRTVRTRAGQGQSEARTRARAGGAAAQPVSAPTGCRRLSTTRRFRAVDASPTSKRSLRFPSPRPATPARNQSVRDSQPRSHAVWQIGMDPNLRLWVLVTLHINVRTQRNSGSDSSSFPVLFAAVEPGLHWTTPLAWVRCLWSSRRNRFVWRSPRYGTIRCNAIEGAASPRKERLLARRGREGR